MQPISAQFGVAARSCSCLNLRSCMHCLHQLMTISRSIINNSSCTDPSPHRLLITISPKKNTSDGNEVLPQDTTHLMQTPCYQRGSPCQDPAGNWTTRRPPDHRKETQTAVVWSCLPFIRSDQNHLARHSERGEKTRWTEEEVGKTTSGNGQAWSSASPRGRWRTGKNGENWLQNHLWCPNDPRG